jgi:hypothetical protein
VSSLSLGKETKKAINSFDGVILFKVSLEGFINIVFLWTFIMDSTSDKDGINFIAIKTEKAAKEESL